MRRTSVAIGITLGALGWSSIGFAATTTVPTLSKVRAKPSHFCARKTSTCRHEGTHVRFALSADATVRGDLRERAHNTGSFVEFVKKLKAGSHDVYLHDKRLHPGTWTLRVQPTGAVGAGHPVTLNVHVVKHD
jgi:hypothetical protein